MKNWLLATSLFAVLSGAAQAQIDTPCTCPKFFYGSGSSGGVTVYYYYSLRCPENQPHMFVSTAMVNQFNGYCISTTHCGGSDVFPQLTRKQNATEDISTSRIDIQKSHYGIPSMGTTRYEPYSYSLSVHGLSQIPRSSAEITKPEFPEDVGISVGEQQYFEVTIDTTKLRLTGFPMTIHEVTDGNNPLLKRRIDVAEANANLSGQTTVTIVRDEFMAGVVFEVVELEQGKTGHPITNATLVDPQPEKLPNRTPKFNTRAIYFQHNGVDYVGVLGTTLHSK